MVKKTIDVILNQDINKLGKIGEVKSVSLGYARNYLLPSNLAAIATSSIMAKVQKQLIVKQQQEQKLQQEYLKVKQALEALEQITIHKQVGKQETIFGSVTSREIADILSNELGYQIDKKSISIPDIENLGIYDLVIQLHSNRKANLKLQVLPQA